MNGSSDSGRLGGSGSFQPQPVTAAEAFVQGGRRRLRTLVVRAAPLAAGMPLDLRQEWALLRSHAEKSRVPVTLFRLLPPTPQAFFRALQQCAERGVAPHIVHFAGHGQPRHLCFEDELGREAPLQHEDLAVALHASRVPVVVLNACHSATWQTVSLARYLVDEGAVEVAVGHREPVTDRAAIVFAGELYRRLCSGEEAMLAFVEARNLLSQSHREAATAIELHGNDGLRLMTHPVAGAPGARVFDGTHGRGRMPEVPAFLGREEELLKLAGMLARESMRGAALAGIGGIGKTALALELANRQAWRFPGGVAFVSACSILFGEPSADELVRSAAAALMVSAKGGADPVERLLGHLQQHPGMLVFDNLEDLPEQELERLLRVIEQLPLNGSKALLTSRTAPSILYEWPWLQVETLARGLADRAGAAYLVRQGREKGVEVLARANTDDSGQYQGLPLHLTRALGGHPKMLDVAVGIAARGLPDLHQAVPVLDAEDPQATTAGIISDEALAERMDALFSSSVDLVDEDGRWLLALLPFFPDGSFTTGELLSAALAAYDEGEREATDEVRSELTKRLRLGLESCRRAGLVDLGAEDLVRCHLTVREHIRQRLPLTAETRHRMLLGQLEAALSFIAANQDSYPALDRRLGHLLGLLEAAWAMENGPRDQVTQAVDSLCGFLLDHGYWPIMARWQQRLADRGEEDPQARSRRLHRESILLLNQGRVEEARTALEESLRTTEGLGDRQGRASCLHQLAIIELRQGRYDEAYSLLDESIQAAQEIGDTRGRSASLHQLATIEASRGRYNEACDLLRESVQILADIGDVQGQAASLHLLAMIEIRQGRYSEARDLLRESIRVKEAIGDTQGRAASLHQLAVIEYRQGRCSEARALLHEERQIVEEIGDTQGLSSSLHQLAVIEESQGRLDEAQTLLRESMQLKEVIGDAQGCASIQLLLATIESRRGRYREARALLRDSLQRFEALGDAQGRAFTLQRLAIIESRQGSYDTARTLMRESIQLSEEMGDRHGRAVSLHQLAVIEYRQGRCDEARVLLQESARTRKEIGDTQGRAASQHMLAMIESHLGNNDNARALLRESLQGFAEVGDKHGRAASQHQLAIIEARLGRYSEARALLYESYQFVREIGDNQGCADSLHQLAVIEEEQGSSSEARTLLEQSIQIKEEIGDTRGRAVSLVRLGQLDANAGELQTGITRAREAVAILRRLGSGELAQAEQVLRELETRGQPSGDDHDR